MLRVFTAFSGYDSQCLALNRANIAYELVGWSEIDKFAIKAHNALFQQWSDRNFGDISQIDWNQVPDFDLFTYSSPCQDFSNAGKMRGGEKGSGTRSSLLWESEKAIRAKKPKYLLMENVASLVGKRFINTFNDWLIVLEYLGYNNYWQILNAKDYGVPQNRKRVFVVSILNRTQPYYFPKAIETSLRVKDILEENVDESYYLSKEIINYFNKHKEHHQSKGNGFGWKPTDGDIIAHTIYSGSGRASDNYIKEPIVLGWSRDNKGNVVKRPVVNIANCVTACKRDNTQNYVVEPMIDAFRGREQQVKQRKYTQQFVQKDNMVIIPTNTKDGVQMMELGGICDLSYPNSTTRRGRVQEHGTISPTLTCGAEHTHRIIENDYRIRSLTERECFRLMGVSDEDSDKIRNVVSKRQCCKLAGNSIVVDVLVAIFKQLFSENKTTDKQLKLF